MIRRRRASDSFLWPDLTGAVSPFVAPPIGRGRARAVLGSRRAPLAEESSTPRRLRFSFVETAVISPIPGEPRPLATFRPTTTTTAIERRLDAVPDRGDLSSIDIGPAAPP